MKPVQPSCWQSFCCCLNVSPVPVLFPQSMCVPDLFLIYSLWFSGLFCFLFVCFLLLWFPLYMHICNQFLSPSSLLFVLLYFWDFQLIKAGSLFFYQPACAYGLDRFRHQKNLVRVWKSLFAFCSKITCFVARNTDGNVLMSNAEMPWSLIWNYPVV